jgi:S1-C subfamily serine protease
MKKLSFWAFIGIFLFSSIACAAGPNGNYFIRPTTPTVPLSPTPTAIQPVAVPTIIIPTAISGGIDGMGDLLAALYERVDPGVVAIQTLGADGGGLGSGFVYDTKGHIITNYHVVEGATNLEVDFPSGFKVRGKVVGKDLDSDLAVVQVDAPAEQLHPVPMGDSDKIKVGQTVVAIGNPFGLNGTMTVGIVSAKGRTLESLRQTGNGDFFTAGDLIQTDASINPGNSGGPLLNLNGEVIGINRAIRTTGTDASGDPINSGIGFAVSINIIKRVAPVLIDKGSYDYPYLGVTARPNISLLEQEQLGLAQSTGAYITQIVSGGPADKAGLVGGSKPTDIPGLEAGGDLVVAVDGRPILVFGDLLSYLMVNKAPGDSITLTILRDKNQKEVTLTLGKRP